MPKKIAINITVTEEIYSQHVLQSIPKNIWSQFFTRQYVTTVEIPEAALHVGDLKHFDAMRKVDRANNIYFLPEQRSMLWFTLAYNNPNLSDEELLSYTKSLNLSPQDRFNCIISFGRLSLVKRLIEQYPSHISAKIKNNHSEALFLAAKFGRKDVLEHLSQVDASVPTQLVTAVQNHSSRLGEECVHTCKPLALAARHGQLETVKYLLKLSEPSLSVHYLKYSLLTPTRLDDDLYGAFRSAALGGHSNVLRYLMKKQSG